ncbi:Flp pilus assembly protein CpaB [Candidatus Saccharibacteria bacterium]|nr:Flp pilus assembly protein CpaB [Candidatus Saccharibacteria bacterium]
MAAKPRAVIVVAILAVAIAVVASVALYNYLKGKEAEVREAKEAVVTERIVVAAQEIPIGTPVEARQVKLADWPKVNVPMGAFSSIEAVTGRVALQTLMEGDVITEPKLRPTEGPPGVMTYKIPTGHRAMTVAVDQVSGVAGFITPGSMVDIVLTTETRSRHSPISRIIFQNVPVLATGQIIETKEGEPVLVPTVTLDVTPEDAEKLATATSEGQLRLLLRRVGDTEIAETRGATVTQVIGGVSRPAKKSVKRVAARAPVRRKPRATTVDVEVWRAQDKKVESFKVKKEAAK